MAIEEINEAYETGKKHERERILNLIKAWELTDFGNDGARFSGMQKLKQDVIKQEGVSQ